MYDSGNTAVLALDAKGRVRWWDEEGWRKVGPMMTTRVVVGEEAEAIRQGANATNSALHQLDAMPEEAVLSVVFANEDEAKRSIRNIRVGIGSKFGTGRVSMRKLSPTNYVIFWRKGMKYAEEDAVV